MPNAPGFKQCASCAKPMPTSDPHDSCLKCLGESHQTDKCKICKAFKPRTKKERDFRLRQLLMEAALSPDTPSTGQAPAPSTSVRSAPAAPAMTTTRVASDKPPRHRTSSAPQAQQVPRRRSLSPGHKKAHKTGTSVPKTPAPPVPGVEPRPPVEQRKQVPPAPSTPAPRPLSPVQIASPPRPAVIQCLPSTPETFAAARDLIALTEPAPPQPPAPTAPLTRPVQSRGKPALMRPPSQGLEPRHRSRSRSRSPRRSQSRHRISSRHRSYSRPRSSSRHRSTSRHRYDRRHRSTSRRSSRHRYGRRSTSRGRSRHRAYSRSSSRSRSDSRHRRGHRHRSRSRHRSPAPRRDRSSPDRHRAAPQPTGIVSSLSAPPWPSRSVSRSSEDLSRSAYPPQGQAEERNLGHWQEMAEDHSHGPSHWSFWTPWAYHQEQGAPIPSTSRSGHSVRRAPESTISRPPPGGMEASVSTPPDTMDPSAGDAPAQEQGDQDPPLDPVPPEASSSSSPDEAVAGTSCTGPPPIDLRAHQDLLRRMARNMDLQAEEIVEVHDPIVNILGADAPSRVALPLIRTIQTNADTIWKTPASIPPTARGVERKYFVPSKDYGYLYTHPQPCSLVVESVNARERHGQQAAAPKSKEAKRLDLFGRKVYSAGGLQLRAANQQALLSRYNFNSWNSMGKFKELIPQESREEFGAMVEEGKKVARTSLQASLDIADSAARTLASGIAMRRISWLQVSGLPPELQQTLQDLPFEGHGLFSDKTDSRLQSLKDSRTIMRSLGMHVVGPQRRPFRPQPQRFYPPPPASSETGLGPEARARW
ncbi:serine/arginine repetitive matrix protein 2-like [Chrysemys picta bellii]|uniref:serine/arginine repetitive matrix protein 2-like n=1 Tax=Chrysemys picta bellii TaxID=8478 RepID=UPI0032B15B5F